MRDIDRSLVSSRSWALNRCDEADVRRPWWDRLHEPEVPKASAWSRVVEAALVAALVLYGLGIGALIIGGAIAVWRSIL